MTVRPIQLAGLLLAVAVLGGAAASSVYEPKCGVSMKRLAKSGERWALIVSVNEYEGGSDAPLLGPGNDMEELCRLLTRRFGLPERHVLRLHGPDATRAGMLAGFEALRQRGTADGQLIFAYAGHGAFIADQDPDEEPDGQDETLCPWDHATAGDLRDDHLEDLYAGWLGTGAWVTVLLDSCHSGSSMRGGATDPSVRARLTEPSPAGAPYDGSFRDRLDARTEETRARFLSLAAASDDEMALEKPLARRGETRNQGYFSYALLNALQRLPRGATWQDVASRVRGDVMTLTTAQHPVFVGDLRRGLFGAAGGTSATYRVLKVGFGRPATVRLDAGEMAGLDVGARFSIAGSLWEVTSIGATSATATRLGDDGASPGPGDAATLLSLGASRAPVSVSLDPALPGPMATALLAALEADPMLTLDADGPGALAVVLRESHGGCASIVGGPAPWPAAGCRRASGEPIDADRVGETLTAFAAWRRFLELRNEGDRALDVAAALQLEVLRDDGGGWVAANADPADPSSVTLHEEDRFGLAYTNRTDQPLFVTVVYLSGDGGIIDLNAGELTQPLLAGQRVDLGALLRIGPPYGTDFIKVFVGDEVTGPFDPQPFLQRGALRDGAANAGWAAERFARQSPPPAAVRGWGALEIPLRIRP